MSHIKKLENGRYRVRYRDPSGRTLSKNFVREGDARKFLTSIDHSKLSGAYVDPAAGRKAFKDYGEEWRAIQIHRPSTAHQLETNLRRHVYPTLGHRPLAAIRTTEVQALVRKLEIETKLAPATVALVYTYVSSIFRAAVTDRLIASSPCIKIKLPTVEPRKVEPLLTEVVDRLADEMPARYRALVVLAAGTGMRQGECFGLTRDRIDFLRRKVKIDRQLSLVPGSEPVLAPLKTAASYHDGLPLPQVVVDALAAHLAAFPVAPDGLVFTDDKGRPIRRNHFSQIWRPAATKAGVPADDGFHALRHFYASLLIRAGVDLKTVQSMLRHKTADETLNTYAHLWPDSDDRTRAAVDAALKPVGSGAGHTAAETS